MRTAVMVSLPCCAAMAGAICPTTRYAAARSVSGPTARSMKNGENPMAPYLPKAASTLAALALVSGMNSGLPLRVKRSQTSSKYSR